jgi:hypothetical protein
MALFVTQTAIIPAGQALSAAVPLGENQLHGILLPSVWTTANLTFQISIDGSNYFEMYDDAGNEVTVQAAASRYCSLDPTRWRSINGIIVRSGTSASPVNQVAQASISLMTRSIF